MGSGVAARIALAVLLCMMSAQRAWCAGAAGKVVFAIGGPTVTGADSKTRPLKKGADVYEGDLVHTGAGRVQLRFTDGAFLSLQPDTQFKVEKYHFTGAPSKDDKGVFNLVKGGMRTITGLIGKHDRKHYQVHTKVATIGVRGTEYSLTFDGGLQGSVASGQINVCNSGGCAPFARGESFFVPTSESRPVLTLRKADVQAPQPNERKPQGPPGAPNAEGSNLPPPDQVGVVQGNTTDASGVSVPFKLTGTHLLMAVTAKYTASGLFGLTAPFMATVTLNDAGQAQSIGATTLSAVTGGSDGLAAGGAGVLSSNGDAFHYMVGFPTPLQDIQWLQTNAPIAHYSGFKGTDPTGFIGGAVPPKEFNIGKFVGGSLTADFTAGVVSAQINLDIGGNPLSVTSTSLAIATGTQKFQGACSAGTPCSIDGFFVGPNAAKALLGYEFGGAIVNGQSVTGRGTAAFNKDP